MTKILPLLRVFVAILVGWLVFLPPQILTPWTSRWHRLIARIASHWFDLIGVLHLRNLGDLELGSVTLTLSRLIGPFCSPLLFVSLVAIYLWLQRPPLRYTCRLLATAVVLSPLVALLSVLAAGYTVHAWQWDFTSRAASTLLNLFSLLSVLGLLYCSDRLASFVAAPMIIDPQELMPITLWWNRVVAGLTKDPCAISKDGMVRVPNSPSNLGILLHHWSKTRDWMSLIVGLPLILLTVSLLIGWYLTPGDLVPRYQSAITSAAERRVASTDALDQSEAERMTEVYGQRLLQLSPSNVVANKQMALLDEQSGEIDRARERMQLIAPLESGGDPEAHRWLARDLEKRARTPVEIRDMLQHLEHVAAAQPGQVDLHEQLAGLYQQFNNRAKVAEHLLAIIDQRPKLLMALAETLWVEDEPQARLYLEQASEHFRLQTESDSPEPQAYLDWLSAELALQHFDVVKRTVTEAKARAPDPRYDVVLARMYLSQARKAMNRTVPTANDDAIELMHQALDAAPQLPATADALYRFSVSHPKYKPDVIQWLNETVAVPDHDGHQARFVLGNFATLEEDFVTASRHYEQALKLAPERVELLNNLAWSLGHLDPPELERALELSSRALESNSPIPHFRLEFHVTRGLLLVMDERYEEAITHLELAFPDASDRPHVREGLAKAYDALGMSDVASEHRAIAKAATSEAVN